MGGGSILVSCLRTRGGKPPHWEGHKGCELRVGLRVGAGPQPILMLPCRVVRSDASAVSSASASFFLGYVCNVIFGVLWS